MEHPSMDQRPKDRRLMWLGALLLVVGFLGHYFAARAIGGSYVAFRDHIGGFLLILVVTGAIIAGLGRLFWRGRTDITLLIIGMVQALFGIFVYINRFSVHG
ncbi:MAG TPA: hypothetical protein VGO33_11625 [Gemmatimonadaceae bacterium]|nr:hypothetical protein [Gemmatimonadaceae bacterium]